MSTNEKGKTSCAPAENSQPFASPCICRQCGQPMEAVWQPALLPGRTGFWYLTCWGSGCALNGYTFTNRTYATMDLTAYLVKD